MAHRKKQRLITVLVASNRSGLDLQINETIQSITVLMDSTLLSKTLHPSLNQMVSSQELKRAGVLT
jgi:hypothetical protein